MGTTLENLPPLMYFYYRIAKTLFARWFYSTKNHIRWLIVWFPDRVAYGVCIVIKMAVNARCWKETLTKSVRTSTWILRVKVWTKNKNTLLWVIRKNYIIVRIKIKHFVEKTSTTYNFIVKNIVTSNRWKTLLLSFKKKKNRQIKYECFPLEKSPFINLYL
jgi:hypothetical protein